MRTYARQNAKIAQLMPRRMPELMPERTPNYMPDRSPEHICQIECQFICQIERLLLFFPLLFRRLFVVPKISWLTCHGGDFWKYIITVISKSQVIIDYMLVVNYPNPPKIAFSKHFQSSDSSDCIQEIFCDLLWPMKDAHSFTKSPSTLKKWGRPQSQVFGSFSSHVWYKTPN